MSSWTIYGANGSVKAVVKELELHDEWMAECFLTITVNSATPIDFEVGDYIDYRDERYTINYDPSVLKKARRGTYGEGFTYENIKFVAVQDEVVRCDFNDIVLSDNQMHYTQLPTFPFYCETVDDLLDRIQANLEDLYPGGWTLISPDLDKDRQRGMCVGREEDFVDAYNRYIGGGTFTYEKTGVALTADNNTCWDALKWVNEQFDLNFVVRGRVIIVGTTGAVIGNRFRYGKGEGLYEVEKISDSEQKIITRLRGYGAETNLPDRYYSERNARPCFYVSELDPAASTPQVISVLIDNNKFNNVFTEIIDEVYGSMKIAIGECEMDGIEFSAGFELVNGEGGCTTRMLIGATGSVIIADEEIPTNPQSTIDALKAAMVLGSKIIFNSGVNKKYVDSRHITASSTGLPDNMSVNRLMLPGFPSKSLAEWVEDHMDNEKVAAIVAEGFTFSEEVNRPYIDSPYKEIYGIRPASIYFDGTNDNDDIHPSIEGMTWEGRNVDEVVDATQIDDNGVLAEDATEAEKTFTITIPMAGFTLPDLISDDSSIDMKNGMCGARSFKIKSVKKNENERDWDCTCWRTYDDTLKLYFPYIDFQISPHDNFVLTGIELPDSYIDAASEKLFFATVDALKANHAPRYTFQPRIDEIWMKRQDDIAKSSHGAIASLHDTLKSGDLFSFADEDLGITAQIIIDILTIKENGNNGIPTYEVTLREEKVVSALDKRLDKITSVVSGVGGGLSGRQYSGMIALEGSELFLSKFYDDVAQGVIGFLKGVWFGTKQWFIDGSGNANLYNTTVNGLLKAWNAVINNVRSTNYTGDGMMDSGWRITNEYEGNNSKATFDYLYIRKKAIFEELEIRKLSHIGGNFCLSGASGRVWKVDYFDASGNVLGYDVHVVPWTLGGRIMNLFTKNPTILNKFLGKERKIQRRLTDAERLRVATIRVYMFTDDGSTETMANWTVGAQARCQQFNVEKQMEFDGSSWKGVKDGNTYWYRLVSAVGEQKMEDGLNHEWIEFRVDQSKEGTAYEWADALSDFPSVGDVFVQMGHRTRADQSNIIMLETANADSPAIKMYAGVNWWTYGGKEVAVMSPDGWKVSANRFEWTTSYGEKFRQTVDRGAWVNIPVDENNKRRCYFNDVVSHNGCLWRCIVAEGTYTTDEPSDSSTAWIKEVSAGIAPYVSLSEQIVSIPCEKDSTATAAVSKTVVVKLMVSNLEATITGVTLTGADAHVYKSGNNIVISFAAGASVENKNYTVAVTGDLNGNHYEAENTLGVYAAIKGNDGFEISAAPDVFIWNQAETAPYPINIDKSETGNSSTLITVTNDGVAQPFTITNVTASGKNASGQATTVVATYSNVSHRVWVTSIANDTEQGQIQITVRYNGTATKTLVLQFYCNLLGTWKEWVVGDTKTEVAERMRFDICDETGAVIGTSTLANYVKSSSQSTATLSKQTADLATEDARLQSELNTTKTTLEHSIEDAETTLNAAIQSSATTLNNKIDSTKTELEGDISSTDSALRTAINTAKTELEGDVNTVSTNLATYEQSNDRAVAALTTRVSNSETAITNTNTRVDTAEGSIQTISSELETVDGKFGNYYTKVETSDLVSQRISTATQGMVTTSNFQQTASSFSLVTETTAQGYANTAESNAKNAAQGYANTAENNAKTAAQGYADDAEDNIKDALKSKTGIDIDGTAGSIVMYADKVTFKDSHNNGSIYFDNDDNEFKFIGKIQANGGFDISTTTANSNFNVDVTGTASISADGGTTIGKYGNTTTTIRGKYVSIDGSTSVSVSGNTTFNNQATFDGQVNLNSSAYRKVTINGVTYTVKIGDRLCRQASGTISSLDEIVMATGNITLPSVSDYKHITIVNGTSSSIRITGSNLNGYSGSRYVNVEKYETIECFYGGSGWVVGYISRSAVN